MVQKFEMDESMMTGITIIDLQHKAIITTFNNLADAIEKGQGADVVGKILAFLRYYIEWHFECEEECADKYRCPIAPKNKEAHKKFTNMVYQLEEQYHQSGPSQELALRIHNELANWFVNHIKRIDTQIGEHIRKR